MMYRHSGHALVVVEPLMVTQHVGVRRVILDYWHRLRQLGFVVHLGVVLDGTTVRVSPEASDIWFSAVTRDVAVPYGFSLDWRDHLDVAIDHRDYDVSLISNPWLCASTMPEGEFTFGIVYDLVPNLIGMHLLDVGLPPGSTSEFAFRHHLGFSFYVSRVRHVLCISQSTKRDFDAFYHLGPGSVSVVDVPFRVDHDVEVREALEKPARRILAVNVLDPRKNFREVCSALVAVAKIVKGIELDIVGRERISRVQAENFVEVLRAAGVEVRWHREATDRDLDTLYVECDMLLFPSLYEGLGLPPLEAQLHGTPAITSNSSSLVELNLNESLIVNLNEPDALERVLLRLLQQDPGLNLITGRALHDEVVDLIAPQRRFEELVALHRSGRDFEHDGLWLERDENRL